MKRLRPTPAGIAARTRAQLAGAVTVVVAMLSFGLGLASAQTTPPDPTSSTTWPTNPTSTGSSTTTTSTTTPESTTTSSSSTSTLPPLTTTTANGPTTTLPPGSGVSPGLVDDLKAGSDELTEDELQLLQKFLDAQGEVNSVTDQLILINEQFLASQQDLLDAISKVADADARLKRTSEQLVNAQSDLDKGQKELQEDAISAYVGGGRNMSQAKAIMQAHTVDDLSRSMVYASAVAEDEKDLVDHYRELKRQVDDLRRQADQERNDASTARDGLAARQAVLEQQKATLADAREKKQESVDEKVRLLAEVEQKKGDFFLRMSAHQSSGGDLGAKLRKIQAGQVLPSSTTGIMRQPLDKYRLTSPFGNRVSPLYGASNNHPGIDMAIQSGTPIHAALDGKVIMAEYFDGYGNCVVIEHGNGLATLYGHQTAVAVAEGDHVATGQTIGYVGSTGNSTGPHLHWEVRVFGEVKDPLLFMRPI